MRLIVTDVIKNWRIQRMGHKSFLKSHLKYHQTCFGQKSTKILRKYPGTHFYVDFNIDLCPFPDTHFYVDFIVDLCPFCKCSAYQPQTSFYDADEIGLILTDPVCHTFVWCR